VLIFFARVFFYTKETLAVIFVKRVAQFLSVLYNLIVAKTFKIKTKINRIYKNMKIPFFKKNNFLGIDFGTSSIKVVELSYKSGNAHLMNYGWIKLPTKTKASNLDDKARDKEDSKVERYLLDLLGKMDTKSDLAHISIGGYRGLSALIKVDKSNDGDIAEIIKAEAGKHIPVSLDEVYLSWDVVSKTIPKKKIGQSEEEEIKNKFNKKKESAEVLLVAAPKEDVRRYEEIAENAELKVKSLELDIFSVVRALVGNDLGKFLIIDMGAKVTNLLLVEKGIIKINRNISSGGNEITKNIVSTLNVSWERAEAFKEKNDYMSNEGKQMVAPVLETIAKESNRIINSYFEEEGKDRLDDVILTGGGSGINNVDKLFADIIGMSVSVGNPWKKLNIESEKIKKNNEAISRPFTVATGLALKGVDGL